jgi:tRNA A37 threonylcarbamoyladenosine dehydratase
MTDSIDLPRPERRFGGINRLYGETALNRLSSAHAIVIGIGGVGSWAAEALARSGVGRLTLVDLDHVAESNFNRQLHALAPSLGQAKVEAMAERIALINPACVVHCVDDFLTPDNVAEVIGTDPHTLVLDAIDQVAAKVALLAWCKRHRQHVVTCGAAGGKLRAERVQVADLSETTQDPLLAKVRTGLRRDHGFPAGQLKPASSGKCAGNKKSRFGIEAVFSTEAVKRPLQEGAACAPFDPAGGAPLACAGYGSLVTVTAVFGLVAAGRLMDHAIMRS